MNTFIYVPISAILVINCVHILLLWSRIRQLQRQIDSKHLDLHGLTISLSKNMGESYFQIIKSGQRIASTLNCNVFVKVDSEEDYTFYKNGRYTHRIKEKMWSVDESGNKILVKQ